jgi:hypothetical protein
MDPHRLRIALSAQLATVILEVTDQFFFLGIAAP